MTRPHLGTFGAPMPEPTLSDALDAAGAILIRAAEQVPGDTTATQAAWVTIFAVMGGITTACAFAVIVWKIARPHVDKYVRSLLDPVAAKVSEVHRETTVNGGKNSPPTMLDKIGNISREVNEVRREVGEVRDEVTGVRADLENHEAESGRYLGHVSLVLSEHGIKLPLPSDRDDQP